MINDMKPIIQKLGLLVAALLTIFPASAYDFEVDGIYYKITSMSDLEVGVTYKEQSDILMGFVYCNNSYQGDITIPPTVNYNNRTFTVTSIGDGAFGSLDNYAYCPNMYSRTHDNYGCKITNVKLPETILRVGDCSFKNCRILRQIELPKSLESIGKNAFMSSSVSSVVVPNNVKLIQESAFYDCNNLIQVIIGDKIQTIENSCFVNCPKLMEVFCTSTNRPNGLSMETFSGAHSALEIYVPSYTTYGFGKEYLYFPSHIFQYSGLSNNIEWKNNLKAYKCEIAEDDCKTEINAGAYTNRLVAKYSDGIDLSVEIPFEYTISKAPMSLTIDDVRRQYGDPNPAFTCKISGFVDGENEQTLNTSPIFECEATPLSNVGNYRILASLDAPNYDVTYKYGTLSVIKAALSVSVINSTKIYGEENPEFTLSYSGLKNSETSPNWTVKPKFSTTADLRSSVGEYDVNVMGGDAKNYEVKSYTPGLLTILKRNLTVKADNCERLYGETNPDFLISYIGFVNGDSKTSLQSEPKAECAATKESDAGTYAITVSGGSAENYKFVYQDGQLVIKPLTVGFKDVYNSVTYNDMSVSTDDNYFNFIPEITGPFCEDDFWVELWFLDKDNQYSGNYVTIIGGGEYAGNYVNTNVDRPMWAGKYIFNLTSKGTNPNVEANPSRAYLTVNRTSNNLEWNTSSPIKVKVGEEVDLGISYQADLWCKFNTDYDENIISLSSKGETSNDPHWFATGLKEGETTLSFSIECRKNEFGFYDFSDSGTITKKIIVEPSSGVEGVIADNNNMGVKVINGRIIIDDAPENTIVRVFNLQGTLVAESQGHIIDGLQKGIYIVSVCGKSFKVAL